MQDDSYLESYISTIGVDFVSDCFDYTLTQWFYIIHNNVQVLFYDVENTHSGAGWKNY